MKLKINSSVLKKTILPLILLLGFTPLIWFLGKSNALVNGTLINGVDTNFPLNPLVWFLRRFFVWNGIANAGNDFSSSTAGILFHFIQALPYALGFSLQFVQIISLLFWFLGIVYLAYYFSSSIFGKKSIANLIFVVFYSFNTYLFNTWENVKVANLSLVIGIPLALGIINRLNNREISWKKAAFLSIPLAILISGTGINPAYFITLYLIIFVFQFGYILTRGKNELIFLIRNLLIIYLAVFLFNLFWIIPTLVFILGSISPSASIGAIGFTNWLNSLSENTNLVNVLRLQGAWDWYAFDQITKLPLYIPYALNYFRKFPFVAFSILLPTLALLSLIVGTIRTKIGGKFANTNYYLSFAVMMLLGTFLGAGSHHPTGVVFVWLSEHVPFFSLFRSPWYIFTPLLIFSYAALFGLLYQKVDKFFKDDANKPFVLFNNIFFLVLVLANLVYCYPLVTGKIFRIGRSDGFFVKFPQYVFDANNWSNKNISERVISYPDDEIENYAWGYRGIESILSLGSNVETVFSALNATSTAISETIKDLYLGMKMGQLEYASGLADRLNIGYIFLKGDQPSLAPKLANELVLTEKVEYGPWKFIKFPIGSEIEGKIYSTNNFFYYYPYNAGAKGFLALPLAKQTLLNPDDKVAAQISDLDTMVGRIVLSENTQEREYREFNYSQSKLANRLTQRDLSKVLFTFYIPKDGNYRPQLERYKLDDFGIDPTNDLEVVLDGKKEKFKISDINSSVILYEEIFLTKGNHKTEIYLVNNNLVGVDVLDNQKFNEGGYGTVGEARYRVVDTDGRKYLEIYNIGKADVSADFDVQNFDFFSPYLVEFDYRQIYGNNGVSYAGQSTKTSLVKTQTERLPNYPEWNHFSYYYEPVKTNSEMKVILSAPYTNDPLGTKINYDNITVRKVFTNKLLFMEKDTPILATPNITFEKISPVKYKAKVKNVLGPHVIIFAENYHPAWKTKLSYSNGGAILGTPLHFSANLYANAWYLKDTPSEYDLEIYFENQKYFYLGVLLATLSAMIVLTVYLKDRK